jgi:hypothetical protein
MEKVELINDRRDVLINIADCVIVSFLFYCIYEILQLKIRNIFSYFGVDNISAKTANSVISR